MILTRDPTTKPEWGAQLNPEHPLASGLFDCLLFNEGMGKIAANLAAVGANATPTGTPLWTPTSEGVGVNCSAGSSFDIPHHGSLIAGDFAVRVRHRPNTWANNYDALIEKASGGSRELSVFIKASGDGLAVTLGGTFSDNVISIGLGMPAGVVSDFVLSRRGTLVTIYVNARMRGSFTASGTTGFSTLLAVGRNSSGGGSNYNGTYLIAQTWRRALAADEVFQLYTEPYAMIAPLATRRFYSFSSALVPTFRIPWALMQQSGRYI